MIVLGAVGNAAIVIGEHVLGLLFYRFCVILYGKVMIALFAVCKSAIKIRTGIS